MLYRKNVGPKERWMRGVIGASMLLGGLLWYASAGRGLLLAAAGAGFLLTGFVGFCPACALVGRRLKGPQ